MRLHGGGLGQLLPPSFFQKSQTCSVVCWLSKPPQLSSYFLSRKIPSPRLVLSWRLLLRGLDYHMYQGSVSLEDEDSIGSSSVVL